MATLGSVAKGIGKNVFNQTLGRLFGAGLSKGAEPSDKLAQKAEWSVRDGKVDQRVKVTLPPQSELWDTFFGGSKQKISSSGSSNSILQPLSGDGGVTFPLTPSIIIQHSASYNALSPTHSNYPFYAYDHSELPSFTVVGEFPVQNSEDAKYWVGMVHFFRSVTKMFFGTAVNKLKGNPPPILELNGHGKHVFSHAPVVVTNFTVDMRSDVDYICTEQNSTPSEMNRMIRDPLMRSVFTKIIGVEEDTLDYIDNEIFSQKAKSVNGTWAPTLSQVTLQLQPVYSKESTKKFNMQDFVNGRLTGSDTTVGYI